MKGTVQERLLNLQTDEDDIVLIDEAEEKSLATSSFVPVNFNSAYVSAEDEFHQEEKSRKKERKSKKAPTVREPAEGDVFPLEKLPVEVLSHVLEYVEPIDLLHVRGTSRALRSVTDDVRIWQKVFNGRCEQLFSVEEYIAYMKQTHESTNRINKEAGENARKAEFESKVWSVKSFMETAFFNNVTPVILLLLVLLGSILIPLRMDRVIRLPWIVVFIPVLLVSVFCAFAITFIAIAAVKLRYPPFVKDFYKDDYYSDNEGELLYWFLLRPFNGYESGRVIPHFLIVYDILLSLVFLSLHLTWGFFSWQVTVIPLHFLLILAMYVLIFVGEGIFSKDEFLLKGKYVLFFVCMMIQLFLSSRNIDEQGIFDWNLIFIPGYIILSYGFIRLFLDACLSDSSMNSDHDSGMMLMTFFLIFAVIIPGIVFLSLAAGKLNGSLDITWVRVFAPVMVINICALNLGGFFMNFFDNWWD